MDTFESEIFDDTVKPALSRHSKRAPKLAFNTNYCLKQVKSIAEHSAILLTFIKLPFVIKIFVLSVFEWSLKTGFIVFPFLVATGFYRTTEILDKTMIKSVTLALNFTESLGLRPTSGLLWVQTVCKGCQQLVNS